MIDKDTGATCDKCGHRLPVYGSSFQGIVGKIKAAGWRIKKRGQSWFHYCPTCTAPQQPAPPEFTADDNLWWNK